METYKCIIWGMGVEYENLLNQIMFEILKKNISVEAIVCREKDKYCLKRDGFRIVQSSELNAIEFDYLIIASKAFYREIRKEANAIGIEDDRIIDGQKMLLPLFDFRQYVNLLKNPITILSDDCWGGEVYHRLGLPFTSPLINVYWDKEEYIRFIQDPLFYLGTELTIVSDGRMPDAYPIGRLGDGKRSVILKFLHVRTFAEAKEQWDRRNARVNCNNLFAKLSVSRTDNKKEEYLQAYDKINHKKILFLATEGEEEYKVKRYLWHIRQKDWVDTYEYGHYMRFNYRWELDLLKTLNGEEKCWRNE